MEGFNECRKLSPTSPMSFLTSAASYDALQAAEAYFPQIDQSKPTFRRADDHHGQMRTLLDTLVDETQQQSQEGIENFVTRPKVPSEKVFEGIEDQKESHHAEVVDLDVTGEFSLDNSNSDSEPQEAFTSSPKRKEALLGGNSPEGPGVYTTSSGQGLENRPVSNPRCSSYSLPYESGRRTMEWDAVFGGLSTALSPDSPFASNEVFRRSGVSSRGSIDSMSNEAISERAAAWGNGVARIVLKNSSQESTPHTSTTSLVGTRRYSKVMPRDSKHIKDVLSSFQLAFMVCDAINPEGPILYASAGFFRMTGYSAEEVIGRNCCFLQGVDTDVEEVARIGAALQKGESYTGTLLNYMKDGTPFWNLLNLSPISDGEGKVIKYIGMQAEVNSEEASLRVMNGPMEMAIRGNEFDVQNSQCNVRTSDSRSLALTGNEILGTVVKSQLSRFDRDDSLPVFSIPTSKVWATQDLKERSTAATNRYSLTKGRNDLGIQSKTPRQERGRYSLTIKRSTSENMPCGDGRFSFAAGRRHSIESGRRPTEIQSDLSGSQPLIWHLAAERRSENKFGLGSLGPRCEEEVPKKSANEELQYANKFRRGALHLLRLLRNLDWKLSSRPLQGDTSVLSKRNNLEAADSKTRFDKVPQVDISGIGQCASERLDRDLNGHSMRHSTGGLSSDLLKSAEDISSNIISGYARGQRYSSTITSDTFNRRQFCIIHT